MIQAVFFDFNGVIIDDEPLQLKAYREVLGREGLTLTEEDYYGSLGMDDVAFVRAAFGRAARELTDELLGRIVEEKTAAHRELLKDELPLFPGVVTFIKALARRHALGLVSMARRTEIDHVLERAALGSLFAVVVSAEDVRAHKPDPSCYNNALELLNKGRSKADIIPLSAADCLVVEDAPPGIQAARAAGMRTLGVTNTVPAKALRDAGADAVTHSLADWTTDAVHHVFDTQWGRKD
ncbi:MAG: beta-phosphoglucomutase [Acidobacteriota bacterium]|jgi:phosphoglycolate phosphatase|nr:beta-phosphoglucomutase [Acidobacteriota bacterium]